MKRKRLASVDGMATSGPPRTMADGYAYLRVKVTGEGLDYDGEPCVYVHEINRIGKPVGASVLMVSRESVVSVEDAKRSMRDG